MILELASTERKVTANARQEGIVAGNERAESQSWRGGHPLYAAAGLLR